jgi:hypothetical protein
MFHLTSVIFSALTGKTLYLDPGSGSILIQLLIAAVATVGLIAATSWRRIKLFFSRNKNQPGATKEEDEDDD